MLAAPAEFDRGFSKPLAEDTGKIELIAKSKAFADLSNADFGVEKLIFCLRH